MVDERMTVKELCLDLTAANYANDHLDEDLDVYRYKTKVLKEENKKFNNIKNLASDYNLSLDQVYDLLLETLLKGTGEFDLLEYKESVCKLIDDCVDKVYVDGGYLEGYDLDKLKNEVKLL